MITQINQFKTIFSTVLIISSIPNLLNSPIKLVFKLLFWKLSFIFLFFVLINIGMIEALDSKKQIKIF